jgi:hypothetical protein
LLYTINHYQQLNIKDKIMIIFNSIYNTIARCFRRGQVNDHVEVDEAPETPIIENTENQEPVVNLAPPMLVVPSLGFALGTLALQQGAGNGVELSATAPLMVPETIEEEDDNQAQDIQESALVPFPGQAGFHPVFDDLD